MRQFLTEQRQVEINELVGKVSDCEPINAIKYHKQLIKWLKELKQTRQAVQDIKAEIKSKREFYSQEIDDGDDNIAFGLELAFDIIEEHMNGESENADSN